MKEFSISWLVSSVALAFTAWILGSHMDLGANGSTWLSRLLVLALVGLFFTAISEFLGKIIKVLAIPFIVVTLGIALIVINAWLLMLTQWVANLFGIDFFIDGFWWAACAAIIISISQMVVRAVVESRD